MERCTRPGLLWASFSEAAARCAVGTDICPTISLKLIDEVGGAGRGSFNHRFGQASRDAEQFFNIHFPIDMFPFTDGQGD